MVASKGHFRVFPAALAAAVLACGGSDSPSGPGGGQSVNDYLSALPAWSQFAPPGAESDSTIDSTRNTIQSTDTVASVTTVDSLGNLVTRQNVAYSCTSVPYSISKTPKELVIYNPDVDILWPGALIQGKTHKSQVGSLLPLTIAERAPVNVSIPSLPTGTNFRTVDVVDQAHVGSAIGDMIGNATLSGLQTASASQFTMRSYNSEQEFALQAGLSGKYLGFSAKAGANVSNGSSERTVTVQFFQRMFDVVIAPPQTPGAIFSSDFTPAKLEAQKSLGRIGTDNLPVYVSQVTYGRMMMFAFTSTASESDIKATLNASYEFVTGKAALSLSTRQQKMLQQARIVITTLGGNDSATASMIRSGDWRNYFTSSAPLSTAAPISYTFRNLGDGSIASVTEATNYNIKTCAETSTLPAQLDFRPQQTITAPIAAPFESRMIDVNGDGRADLVMNHRDPSSNDVAVALGQADGTFGTPTTATHPVNAAEGWGNYQLVTGDFSGDGKQDLAWVYLGSVNKAYVALSTGTGWTFAAVQQRPEGGWTPFKVLAGDTDGDGDDDLVFNELGTQNSTYTNLSNGDGTFDMSHGKVARAEPNWGSYQAWMGDVNKDGRADLIWNSVNASQPNRTYASMYQANGFDLTQGAAYDHPTICCWTNYQRVVGDFNGDGATDVAFSNKKSGATALHMVRSLGNGAWTIGTFVNLGNLAPGDFTAYVGDINGDGIDDFIWNQLTAGANKVHTGLGKANGITEISLVGQTHPASTNWSNAATMVGDVNGDTRDDIVWVIPGASIQVFVGLAKP